MIVPGMDHSLYDYSPLPQRAPFRLPGGAKVAVCPVVFLEDWTLEPPENAVSDPRFEDTYGRFSPDYRTHTWREYGLRVGIFRLFERFEAHGLRATLAANASAARRCPDLLREACDRGWGLAGHGDYANAMISSRMAPEDVCRHVRSCLDDLETATGRRPAGWIGQDFGESAETPQCLAAEGLRWLCDWPNDEHPYLMRTDPPILSVPVLSDLDDVQLLWHRRVPTPRYPDLVSRAYEVLERDGAASARVLVLGIHAWLFGMPHRVRYLDAALGFLKERTTAWHAGIDDLAHWFHASRTEEDTA